MCPDGFEAMTMTSCACEAAAALLGETWRGDFGLNTYTPGCSIRRNSPWAGVWFNTHRPNEPYNGHSMTGQTAPICQPITWTGSWILGQPFKSCDTVCSEEGKSCASAELHKLDAKGLDVFKQKFALAGTDCLLMHAHCESQGDCRTWGSPYIHKNHIADRKCWGGSTGSPDPTVAPCGQRPIDANHRRLCPCA